MSHKFKLAFSVFTIFLIALMTMATARGWGGPLTQTGMDMPTETMQPQSTPSLAVSQVQETLTPFGINSGQSMPSPTMTSIFTGFTPYPNSTLTYNSSMGGSGMMGSCSGMSGAGGMGSMSSMGSSGTVMSNGVITGTVGMNSMGSMGSEGMGSCPMMSSSAMGMNMSGDGSMAGMDMSSNYSILGMDMSGTSGYDEENSASAFSDP